MKTNRPDKALILFEEFVAFLRYHGFPVGIDTHIRFHQLLEGLPAHYPAHKLRTLLAPICATSPNQQEEFYRLFDAYFSRYLQSGTDIPISSPPASGPASSPRPVSPPWLRMLSRRRYYLMFQMGLLLVLGIFGARAIECYIRTQDLYSTWDCMWETQLPRAQFVQEVVPVPEPEAELPAVPPQASDQVGDSLLRLLSERVPLKSGKPLPEDLSDLRAGWWERFGPLLQVLLMVLIITAFIFYESYWRHRRRLLLIREKESGPQKPWSPLADRPDFALYTTDEFYLASRKLREREHEQSQDLDLGQSINQTVESGGYPAFSYRPRSRPPEYLVLIEKQSPHDHQAMLFDQLILELAAQDLYVERFFYEKDPRACWKKHAHDAIYLEDLHRQYPDNRIMIIGDAEPFFDPLQQQLADWTDLLRKWQQVAILSPRSPLDWGRRELELAQHFTFLPATTQALSSITDIFRQDQPLSLRYWVEQNQLPIPPELDSPTDMQALKHYLAAEYQGRTLLPPAEHADDLFVWLGGCALYPELSWDLTLSLGLSLAADRKRPFSTPEQLLKLSQLPWFRQGVIPDEWRISLVESLNPQDQLLLRQSLIRVLKDQAPSDEVLAQHKLLLAVQEAQVKNDLRGYLSAVRTAQDYSLNHEIQDRTVIQYLRSKPRAWLHMALPESMNQLLFRQGIAALGLRTPVRALGTVLLLGLVAATLRPLELDRVKSFGGKHYFLADERDQMRFFTYVGNTYFDSLNFVAARENYERSIALRNQLPGEDYLLPDYNLSLMTWEQGQAELARDRFQVVGETAGELLATARVDTSRKRQLLAIQSGANYNQGVIAWRSQQEDRAQEEFLDAQQTDTLRSAATFGQAMTFLAKGIAREGPAQDTYFNLALQAFENIQAEAPEYLSLQQEVLPLLDSLSRDYPKVSTRARLQKIVATMRGQVTSGSPSVPLVLPEPGPDTMQALPQEFEFTEYLVEGRARVRYAGKYGFIDEAGKLWVPVIYDDAKPFSEGLAAVRIGSKWGYIDPFGEMQITLRYSQANAFRQGWASVKQEGSWGMINQAGRIEIPFRYELPVRFEDSQQVPEGEPVLAAVLRNGKYEFIRKDGSLAMGGRKFQYAENFGLDGRARVIQWDKRIYIDRQGNCLSESCPDEKWYVQALTPLSAHEEAINALAFAPDGNFFVSASADGQAKVWSFQGEAQATLPHRDRVQALAISQDSRLVATVGVDQRLRIWRKSAPGNWSLQQEFAEARVNLSAVAFSPDGRFVATGGVDALIRLYELSSARLVQTLRGHRAGQVNALAFSPNGRFLSSGGDDGTLRFWDWESSEEVQSLFTGEVLSLDWSADGQSIAAGTKRESVQVYRFEQDHARLMINLQGFGDWVAQVRFAPQGNYLLTTDFSPKLQIWKLSTRKPVLTIPFPGTLRAAGFSPDGKWLICSDGSRQGVGKIQRYEIVRY